MRSEQLWPRSISSSEAAYVSKSLENVHHLLLIYLGKMEK